MSYKKTGVFSLFIKSYPEKWKKNPIFVNRGLRYCTQLLLVNPQSKTTKAHCRY